MIGQWAADVAHTAESIVKVDTISPSNASRPERSNTALSVGRLPVDARPHDGKPPAASDVLIHVTTAGTSLSMAEYSHIRTLTEPVSTRKRAKKEEIILLKASVVDGFKCPPWGRPPSSTEFVLSNTTEPFV